MKTFKSLGIFFLILCFGLALFTMAAVNYVNSPPNIYKSTGKVIFENEADYTIFKRAIADDRIKISSIEVLASEPPIIIVFSVTYPAMAEFHYGTREIISRSVGGFLDLLAITGITLGGVGFLGTAKIIIDLAFDHRRKRRQP